MKRKAISIILVISLCMCMSVFTFAEEPTIHGIIKSDGVPIVSVTNVISVALDNFPSMYDYECDVTIVFANAPATVTLLRDADIFSDDNIGEIGSSIRRVELPKDLDNLNFGILYNIPYSDDEVPFSTGVIKDGILQQGATWVLGEGEYTLISGYSGDFHYIVVGGSRTPPVTAPSNTVNPTSSKVFVNGEERNFEAYNIDGNNYFKLRDLAMVLNGTNKQFNVGYDNVTRAVTLATSEPYTAVGGEMTAGDGKPKAANPTPSKIYIDSKELDFTVYNIGGNNFFKLRDLMSVLDVAVTYDATTRNISIDTSLGYTPETNVPVSPNIDIALEKIKQTAISIGYKADNATSYLIGADVKGGVTIYTTTGNEAAACVCVLEFANTEEAQLYADIMNQNFLAYPAVYAKYRAFAYEKLYFQIEDINSSAGKDVLKAILPESVWDKFGE